MYGFKILIRGEYALFSRPEMKVERVSYDVPTPSALAGLISASYWHPGVRYVIDKIVVYRPIDFVNIRRNELSEKVSLRFVKDRMQGKNDGSLYTAEQRTQRASLLLKDVEYGVEFHFVLTEDAEPGMTEEKCYNILLRRLRKGQFFHKPCLGCREFPAEVTLAESLPPSALCGETDLGFMLYDLVYQKDAEGNATDRAEPRFYRPKMRDGVIDVGAYAKELVC